MGIKEYQQYKDFSLGINQNDGPTLIMDNQVVDAENVVFGKGFAQKRHGFEKYSTVLPDPITNLYQYKKNNGTNEYLSVSNNKLYKDVSGVQTSIFGTLTTNNVKMITYKDRSINDVVLIADGGKLKSYNSGTMTVSVVTPHPPSTGELTDPGLNDLDNLTNFRTFALKKNRIFAAAHPTIKNRVHFSFFDPVLGYAVYDYFPAIYFFDVATEENDEITELKVFRNQLIIFCKNSVWALKGDGASLVDYELIKLNVPKGCISPNSVQEVGNNLFFLADDHIYSLFATEQEYISAQIMSMDIAPIVKSVGLSDKAISSSIFFDNKYYLSFPSGLTLVYDTIIQSWTKFTNIKANYFLNRDGVLYFSANDGYIYRFDENLFNDDGQSINYMLRTKIYNFDLPINYKKYNRMWVTQKQYDGFNSTYNLSVIIDQYGIQNLNELGLDFDSSTSATWDESLWDVATWDFRETTQLDVRIGKKGEDIQVIVSNDNLNQPFSLYSIVIEYVLKKPKHKGKGRIT